MEKVLSNDFMQKIATEKAWKELSEEFTWSEALLEKYQDKVDWNEISENRHIRWTIPMIQKFQNKINWEIFSECAEEETLSIRFIRTFKDKWDWKKLSGNHDIPLTGELLDEFADNWDWDAIINNYCNSIFEENPIDFYEKYKEHIPVHILHDSCLWDSIVKQITKQLTDEITA